MKYVLLYQSAPDFRQKAAIHFAAHRERWAAYAERGELLMIGPFADALTQGAMAVFSTRQGAESFAEADPFVLEGAVSSWHIQEWLEALVPDRTDSDRTD